MRRPLVVLSLGLLILGSCGGGGDGSTGGDGDVIAEGRELYDLNCASCHGPDLRGVEGTGPPFLSDIYVPGHHPDESFQSAVANGVEQHHWTFGDMAPIPALDRDAVAAIVAYVRSVQRDEGLIP